MLRRTFDDGELKPYWKGPYQVYIYLGDLSGMKISDISVDISPIYPISVMFDMISAMTDISVLDRYILEISGMWHTRASV